MMDLFRPRRNISRERKRHVLDELFTGATGMDGVVGEVLFSNTPPFDVAANPTASYTAEKADDLEPNHVVRLP